MFYLDGVGESMVSGLVEDLSMVQMLVVGGRWSVGWWRVCRRVDGRWSVVGGLSMVRGFVIRQEFSYFP